MSVLVQRPHQMPGLMTLPRQHTKPSPRRQPNQVPRNTHIQRPTVSPVILSPHQPRRQQTPDTRSNKRRNNNNTTTNVDAIPVSDPSSLFSSSCSTVSASVTQQQPTGHHQHFHLQLATPATPPIPAPSVALQGPPPATPPRKTRPTQSAPSTPAPLPVPANRRRARSPRPTARLPPAFPIDEDNSDDTHLEVKRNRRNTPTVDLAAPANWQQAHLLSKSQGTPSPEISAMRSGSASTPTSPSRPMPVNAAILAHSPTMPNFPVHRAGGHARAPSYPNFPSTTLDTLFSSAMVLETPPRKAHHARGASVSSSLPHPSMLAHAAAKRERTLTGGVTFTTSQSGKFASANFQRAPDAMVLPKPSFLGGRFGMFVTSSGSEAEESGSSSAGEDSEIVDLGEESEDEVVFSLP